MNFLVDTHLLLWAAASKSRLPPVARKILESQNTTKYFSVVSIWEVAIKRTLNKPDFRIDANPLRAGLLRNGYHELALESRHVGVLVGLPLLHSDPFDRILVAQAQTEGMELLTSDVTLANYGAMVRSVL
jgi:PIN domain nuclease of toxin-antitoxin system